MLNENLKSAKNQGAVNKAIIDAINANSIGTTRNYINVTDEVIQISFDDEDRISIDDSGIFLSQSVYVGGLHDLTPHPEGIETVTQANLLSGANAYFSCSGSGTVGSPYLIKPRDTVSLRNFHFKIALDTEPDADMYINLQSQGYDRVLVTISHTVTFASKHIYSKILDHDGNIRPRITAANAISRAQTDVFSNLFTEILDVNSPEIFYVTAWE